MHVDKMMLPILSLLLATQAAPASISTTTTTPRFVPTQPSLTTISTTTTTTKTLLWPFDVPNYNDFQNLAPGISYIYAIQLPWVGPQFETGQIGELNAQFFCTGCTVSTPLTITTVPTSTCSMTISDQVLHTCMIELEPSISATSSMIVTLIASPASSGSLFYEMLFQQTCTTAGVHLDKYMCQPLLPSHVVSAEQWPSQCVMTPGVAGNTFLVGIEGCSCAGYDSHGYSLCWDGSISKLPTLLDDANIQNCSTPFCPGIPSASPSPSVSSSPSRSWSSSPSHSSSSSPSHSSSSSSSHSWSSSPSHSSSSSPSHSRSSSPSHSSTTTLPSQSTTPSQEPAGGAASPTSSKSSPAGTIAASVIMVGIVLAGGLFYFWRKKRAERPFIPIYQTIPSGPPPPPGSSSYATPLPGSSYLPPIPPALPAPSAPPLLHPVVGSKGHLPYSLDPQSPR